MMFAAYLVVCFLVTAAHAQSNLEVRLVDGKDRREGRVEVYYNGAWGTVCDDFWADTEATVVCRSLGFESGTLAAFAHFGEGSGEIVLDDVSCTRNETNLGECSNAGLGVHNCGHSEDAGVFCSAQTVSAELRLVDGTCNSEGRVEVFYDGVWGTICDDFWDDTDAGVVCRSLGYSSGTAVGSAEFGQGSEDMPIIFDDVRCSSRDTALEYCPSNAPFDNNCSHAEDAGVRCTE
ncbi:deleted in malignant brain tumors 1 protein [Strongylocentrotus purpuratus]|uniref:SRCR domain-containing protein n=1 Tax=Strongylocentrotus purpuratus TaxID=7668 RepID=A0A7M7T1V6_STRPU|nr:deleted in malignant brain tumors 1 protein [Strongylocentrotus purpuratus]